MSERNPPERRILPNAAMMGAGETRQLLSALVLLASDLNSTLELPELLELIHTRACEIISSESCALLFYDASENELVPPPQLGENSIPSFHRHIPCDRGVIGLVVKNGEGYACNDPMSDPWFIPETDSPAGAPPQNLLCVPLKADDELIGTITVYNHKGASDYSADDRVLLQAFADMAAVTIAKARLHEEAIEKRKLEREMAVARDIQQNLLPRDIPDISGLSFEATMQPAFHVGGDFYDVFPLPDETACIVVGDVSGKGASAALYMACLHSELRLAMQYDPHPEKVVPQLNEIMVKRSRRGAFISLLLMILHPQEKRGTMINAGHPPPLIYDPAVREAKELACQHGFPLGVESNFHYTATEFSFPPGATLLGFTDGVVEARSNEGTEFGTERLQRSFEAAVGSDTTIISHIKRDLLSFSRGADQYDDITLIATTAE